MDTWSDLCRCCLSGNCEVSFLNEKQNISEKFREVTTIEVNADDGLPQKLCQDCYALMISAYQFRKQCIKMEIELKHQLSTLLAQNTEAPIDESDNDNQPTKAVDDSMKQLEAIIKEEPNDSDDDYYYVLVIDDPNDKKTDDPEKIDLPQIKEEENNSDTESKNVFETEAKKMIPFKNSIDSYLISNTKVSAHVPATILANEEDGQFTEDMEDEHDGMDVDDTQDSNSHEKITEMMAPDDEADQIVDTITGDIVRDPKNIIKILTSSGTEGTILLRGNEGIQYLTDTELVTNDEDGETQEVILCEGDDTSQFQILKYDGSELVIEYADDGQIATVLQGADGRFMCVCGEQFDDLTEYGNHQHKHNPTGDHLCSLCGKGFESAEILTGHMLLHSQSSPLINCPFCNQATRRNALTQHIKYGHNNIKPRCNVCSKTFANPNNLKRHMMIHTGTREFECDICFKRFHQKITMQTHRLTHLHPFSCNHCEKTFENNTDLQEHNESEECIQSKTTKVKEELLKTLKQEVTTHMGKHLGYACSLCKKMFSKESALEQHIQNMHIFDPTELLCSECGEVLPSKSDMQLHIASHKSSKKHNLKRFECSICGKGCSSQAMLIMHERVHTNERPYPCQLCSLRFKTKTHLRTHQLTHTREKKFGCSVCMKFFALKGNLVVHLRTHTGERPYICSLCGEAFIDSKYLKKHKLKKHSIENVPWNQY